MCPTLSTQNSGALHAVAAFLIIVAIPILILFGQDIRPLTGQECPSGLPYAQALQQCWLAGWACRSQSLDHRRDGGLRRALRPHEFRACARSGLFAALLISRILGIKHKRYRSHRMAPAE
jgi:hypothetical protein